MNGYGNGEAIGTHADGAVNIVSAYTSREGDREKEMAKGKRQAAVV